MARPKKPESEIHVNRLSVYLTDDDFTMIQQIASRKGIPAGVIGRSLVVAGLDAFTTTFTGSLFEHSPH